MKECKEVVRFSVNFINKLPVWWISAHVLKVHGINKCSKKEDTIYQIIRHYRNKHGIKTRSETEIQMTEEELKLWAKMPALEEIKGGLFTTNQGIERWGDQIILKSKDKCSSCLQSTQHQCKRKNCRNYICNKCYDWYGQKNDGGKCWKHLTKKV